MGGKGGAMASPSDAPPRSDVSSSPMTAVRVLLVDDVGAFRKLIGTALRLRGGFEVVGEASDGATAAAIAEREQPDVVVLDLGLPDLAGTEVIHLVRARSPRSKIVVFTGRDEDGEAMRSVEGFVRKDDDVALLVDVIAEVAADRVTGGGVSLRLSQELASAAAARRFVEEQCAEW